MAAEFLSRAVFLDRDGVINRSEVHDGKAYAPRTLADFRLLPGVPAAVRALKQAGYLIIVATNQPDIGNGKVDAAVVDAMHDRLRQPSAGRCHRPCARTGRTRIAPAASPKPGC